MATANKAIETNAVPEWMELKRKADALAIESEVQRKKAIASAVARGDEAVKELAQLGEKYSFRKLAKNPRGPNKPKVETPLSDEHERTK